MINYKSMRPNVTVMVKSRFHAFNLAFQLQKLNCLDRLVTSYPKFEVEKYGINRNKVTSLPIHEIDRLWRKLPYVLRNLIYPESTLHYFFELDSKKKIHKDSNIVVAWSSFAKGVVEEAKRKKIISIVEHGSTHPNFNINILNEEYELMGVRPPKVNKMIVNRQLEEFQMADYIAIPSNFVKNTFINNGIVESKLIKVPYGVNLEWFKKIEKKDDVFRIIFCGNMILRKGIQYLLRAFCELNLKNSELVLIGNLSDEIKPFIQKYQRSNIKIKGPYPEYYLHKEYSQGSIFCIASIEEGLAMVQPQAMACGLPLICTKNTGGEELIQDGVEGYVTEIRNVEQLKEKIHNLFINEELRRYLGTNAEKKVKQFTWDIYGKNIESEYIRVLNAK